MELTNIYFTNGNIIKGWIKNIVRNVIQIQITSENLKTLGPEAFSEQPLNKLTKLEIKESKLLSLTKEMFLNSTIQILAIKNDENFIEKEIFLVEPNALEYISKDLTSLTFSQTLGDPQVMN